MRVPARRARDGLAQKWSSEQINKRMKMDYPDNKDMRVSHETIYEGLYLQAPGELRTQLKLAMRTGRRKSRFTILVKIPYDRTAERVAGLLARRMESFPEFMKKSIAGIPVYFCDPHSPWQRGTNEHVTSSHGSA
jgi:transposase, IS30 family